MSAAALDPEAAIAEDLSFMTSSIRSILASTRFRKVVLLAGVVLVFVGSGLAAAGVALTRAVPVWWRAVSKEDPQTIQVAQDLENTAISELSLVRQTDPTYDGSGPWRSSAWEMELQASEANAWLNARLPKWLANRQQFEWPKEVQEVQVEFRSDQIMIGAKVESNGQTHILSVTLEPEVAPDGSIWMRARWVHIGRLAIPAAWVLSEADNKARDYLPDRLRQWPETVDMLRAFAGKMPLREDSLLSLGDGRYVRLLVVKPQHGRLVLTCRTEFKG